jgi:hypothetical protein
LVGASGQLEKRVTSGTDKTARKAAASARVGARSVNRSVDKDGNFRVGRIGSHVTSRVEVADITMDSSACLAATRSGVCALFRPQFHGAFSLLVAKFTGAADCRPAVIHFSGR